jgi:hypothetical protein
MKPTLKPMTSIEHDGRHYGVAEHRDGDHVCHVPFHTFKDGENMAGRNAAIIHRDGSFEMLTPGAKPCQVATEQYRRGWEATFGARGGVS